MRAPLATTLFALLLALTQPCPGADKDLFVDFDDQPLEEALSHPDWFKLSFLDLREDLVEARQSNKRGLLVYFGQKYCAYCKALLEGNFGKPDVRSYTQQYFDVIGLDIHGDRPVTDLEGREWSERSFARHMDVHFTPTLIFYDSGGQEALRLRGYYPPYPFRAALEYVADGHYKREDFHRYLARADVGEVFEAGGLNLADFFQEPPYILDRSHGSADRPLVIFFEQGQCHACDVLHTGPLRQQEIQQRIAKFDAVQLGIWDATPLLTPDGNRRTAKAWADELGLFYTPTLLFFDEQGREIIRVDSVVQFYRLRNLLEFVLSGAYLEEPNFQRWRETSRLPTDNTLPQ